MSNNVREFQSGEMMRADGNRSDWVTPDHIDDPKPLPNVTGWNVLIRPVEVEKTLQTKSGFKLHLPDSFTDDVKYLTNVGQVKAMGPMCYKDPNVKPSDGAYFPYGRYGKPWCSVGDYVVWGKHQGTKLLIKGVAFVLLQDELILMTLENAGDINPMMNAFKTH